MHSAFTCYAQKQEWIPHFPTIKCNKTFLFNTYKFVPPICKNSSLISKLMYFIHLIIRRSNKIKNNTYRLDYSV